MAERLGIDTLNCLIYYAESILAAGLETPRQWLEVLCGVARET
jgi:hypothetical protein